mgnify:CR=1 FL=1
MQQPDGSYVLQESDLKRASLFLSHCKRLFRTSTFIRDFQSLDVILFLYRRVELEGDKVYFSTLKEYVTKSDVYLAKLLKHGIEDGYLWCQISKEDRRLKEYYLAENALSFIDRLKRF